MPELVASAHLQLVLEHFGVGVAAVSAGVAGGMIRDVRTGEIPLVFRREIYLYATAALCGAVVLVLLQQWKVAAPENVLVAGTLTLLLRLAAIRWKLGLPVFSHKE